MSCGVLRLRATAFSPTHASRPLKHAMEGTTWPADEPRTICGWPCRSTYATAQNVVPRSMPTVGSIAASPLVRQDFEEVPDLGDERRLDHAFCRLEHRHSRELASNLPADVGAKLLVELYLLPFSEQTAPQSDMADDFEEAAEAIERYGRDASLA